MEALRRSKAPAGEDPNRPPQRGLFSFSFMGCSLDQGSEGGFTRRPRAREAKVRGRPGALTARSFPPRCLRALRVRRGSLTGRRYAPDRLSLWYFLMADLRVLRPRVALRVRLPTTSRPSPSTKVSYSRSRTSSIVRP